jgi:hypothetical protein
MTALEVIEHLDPHILSRFGVVTMGTYRPRILLVTTPVSLSSLLISPFLFPPHLSSSPPSSFVSILRVLEAPLLVLLLTTRTSTSMPNSPETDMMNQEKDSLIPQEGQRGFLGTSYRPGRQAILFLYLPAPQWLP